jgi:hypothetical protein
MPGQIGSRSVAPSTTSSEGDRCGCRVSPPPQEHQPITSHPMDRIAIIGCDMAAGSTRRPACTTGSRGFRPLHPRPPAQHGPAGPYADRRARGGGRGDRAAQPPRRAPLPRRGHHRPAGRGGSVAGRAQGQGCRYRLWPGTTTRMLAQRIPGADVAGLDLSAALLTAAQDGQPERLAVRFVRADLCCLPLASQSCHVAIAAFCLCHCAARGR